jgi:hypothetical protein
MKYFTRDLIERYGSQDEAIARAAEAEWEAALARYESYLQAIASDLPEHIRQFNDLLLHDAVIWSIARQGDKLLMVMRKDIPPRDVVLLSYTLIGEPVIDREALSPESRGTVMDYQYDEFDLVQEGTGKSYAQTIVFGNGYSISLRFSDVQATVAQPLYSLPDTLLVPGSTALAAKSA